MTYDPEVRANALILYPEIGTAETARRLAVPERTVRRWAEEAGLVAEVNREKIAEAKAAAARITTEWADYRSLEALGAGSVAKRLREELLQASAEGNHLLLRARAIAYGILIDKAEILSRHTEGKVDVWAESELDAELEALTAWFEERKRDGT